MVKTHGQEKFVERTVPLLFSQIGEKRIQIDNVSREKNLDEYRKGRRHLRHSIEYWSSTLNIEISTKNINH